MKISVLLVGLLLVSVSVATAQPVKERHIFPARLTMTILGTTNVVQRTVKNRQELVNFAVIEVTRFVVATGATNVTIIGITRRDVSSVTEIASPQEAIAFADSYGKVRVAEVAQRVQSQPAILGTPTAAAPASYLDPLGRERYNTAIVAERAAQQRIVASTDRYVANQYYGGYDRGQGYGYGGFSSRPYTVQHIPNGRIIREHRTTGFYADGFGFTTTGRR